MNVYMDHQSQKELQDQNKAVIRDLIQYVINDNDLDFLLDYVADDVINHNIPFGEPQGIDAYRRQLEKVSASYCQYNLHIEDQIAEGDLVVTRIIAEGIHDQEYFGLKPSKRLITLTGIQIDRVVDGKIVEHWGETDMFSALMQMGARIVQDGVIS